MLDAVRDVAISSSQLNDLNQQRALQQLKVTAAQTTTDSARAHYQRGLLSPLRRRRSPPGGPRPAAVAAGH
ncbi:Outer membrane component of tripartite multidrug resistance system [Klebsiella pneumoniae IS43]|uniref:Outer membrane component of tripartite multidrug resistance system n=1 Tax=Klebsiella pneumoniae IS43 TaxID=1432552 RepID=W1DSK8_KLEPN|nr:Outer membrane component of tripartite multidrug resistance system [Klebsiella pneumoniae IS43]